MSAFPRRDKELWVRRLENSKQLLSGTPKSLADSIKAQGVLEPLIVRETGKKKYEIVCGERRYRAALLALISESPCLVRKLSDEQVLDIQIHENLHREDIHPMDEAYGYQFLKEKLGCDVKELALRVGKSEGYVLNRLKLNCLIKEAQKDIDEGHLPLVYALEIAKYAPDIQEFIYAEVYRKQVEYHNDDYIEVPDKGQMVPWKRFIEWINTNIHRLLSKAPFDPKAIDLRPDGLACVKCPERTGAAVSLFEPRQIGKKDACLNPACYYQKAQNHVQNRRGELADASGVDLSQIPVVKSWSYRDGENYLGTESAIVIDGAKRGQVTKKCKNAVNGIDIEADNYGQTVQVCLRSSQCKIHWPDPKASSNGSSHGERSSEEKATERSEERRLRREEIWNAKVAEAVRLLVFKQATESFQKKFSITDVGADFLAQLIARFWRMTASGDSSNLNGVVKRLLAEWEVGTDDHNKQGGIHIQDGRSGVEYLKKFKRETHYRLLFLLVHSHKGTIGHGNNYRSQKEVRELATEFEADYALIDAEVRYELCAKKHKQAHQVYLDAVRAKSEDAAIPRLFSEKWKAAD